MRSSYGTLSWHASAMHLCALCTQHQQQSAVAQTALHQKTTITSSSKHKIHSADSHKNQESIKQPQSTNYAWSKTHSRTLEEGRTRMTQMQHGNHQHARPKSCCSLKDVKTLTFEGPLKHPFQGATRVTLQASLQGELQGSPLKGDP